MEEDAIGALKRRAKLGERFGGVNSRIVPLLALVFSLAGTACFSPPRRVPLAAEGPRTSSVERGAGVTAEPEAVPRDPAVVWEKGVGRGITSAVVVDSPVVIATSTSRSVVTFSSATGMQYWIRRFRGPIAGQALRSGDRVFVVAGEREERAYAFDLERGREIWSSRTGRVLFEPAFADGVLFVANEEGQLLALSTRSGESLWEVRPGGPPAIPPFVAGGHVLLATRRDTLYRIDLDTRAVSARLALGSTPSASAVVHGDLAIFPLHSGEVMAVALRDFSTSWRVTLPASSLAPAVVGPRGDTYVLTRSADVWRVPAEGGAPERVVELGGAVSASFTSTRDGLVIGRLDGALFHVAFDGRIIWRYDFEDSIVAPVVAHGGALYVPLLRGDLVKLR